MTQFSVPFAVIMLSLVGASLGRDALAQGEDAAGPGESSIRDAVLRRHARARDEATPKSPATDKADDVWAELLAGNTRFRMGRARTKKLPHARQISPHRHDPAALVLACSDSSVSPELVFDQGLGDLYVVRTAGNVVDPIVLGSIEYAVLHSGLKLLVVLAHEECSAVGAAINPPSASSANVVALLAGISKASADASTTSSAQQVHRSVLANVEKSARDLLERSPLIRTKVEAGEVRLVRAVFDANGGEVVTIP